MTRRLLAGLLTLCMLVSLCPPNAFAIRSSAAELTETEPAVVETEATEATDPTAADPTAADPTDPEPEEKEPNYASVNVGETATLTASFEDGGKWYSDNIAAATVGAESAGSGDKNVAQVYGAAEGFATVTYTLGESVETWYVTVKAAPVEEIADVTYSVSRYLQNAELELEPIDTITVTGKPGADVTLPAVSGAVAVNTDAEEVLPNADGTAALTLPAETPEELSLNVYYVTEESLKETSTLDIKDPTVAIDTYIFVNGEETTTQKIKAGETVYAPASPEKEGYKFIGWFRNDVEFDPNKIPTVTGVTYTYTAKFEEIYYVFFLNEDGAVCATKQGGSDDVIVADVTFPVDANEAITGWYTESALTNRVDSVTLNGANVTLYPKVETGYWITYNADGGTYTAPAFVAPNTNTAEPAEPTREGYTFQGWYNGDNAFTFGTTLSGNVTLTAKWQGNANTQYTVIHWQENVDDDKFSFKESETKTGTTGDLTAAAAKSYDGFTVQTIDQKSIAGDGSTIVNVYYNRNVYTIRFLSTNGGTITDYSCGKEEHTHSWWNGCYDRRGNLTCTKEEHSHDSSCTTTVNYDITAKYGANIRDQWPARSNGSTNWSTKKGGSGPYQAGIDVMPLGGATFYVPSSESSSSASASYYVEVLEGESGTEVVSGRTYKLDHVDTVMMSNPSITWNEDFYDITGFTRNTTDSTQDRGSYNGAKFYYYRNSYEIKFINNGSVAHTVTKQYEADISDVSYEPTRPAGIPAEYEFVGWYDNELGQGEEYVFSGKMPAKSITVYAKWAAPTYVGTAHLTMEGTGEFCRKLFPIFPATQMPAMWKSVL